MATRFVSSLSPEELLALRRRLHEAQRGLCFICEDPIDLTLHAGHLDIDHVEPTATGGKDHPSNFALTHDSCNRQKQAADLRVARVLSKFERIREKVEPEGRSANVSDVLAEHGGAKYSFSLDIASEQVRFCFPDLGDNRVRRVPLYRDDQSGLTYFFAEFPIEYLHHDDRIKSSRYRRQPRRAS